MKKLHALIVALGLAFAIYIIHRIGVSEIWKQLNYLGWGLLVLILAEGVAELFHAISWRYCLSGSLRSIPLSRLFQINMAGYAISYFTPTASLGGDVAKAGLLALNHKGPQAVSGVLISKLSFALAHLFLVVLGTLLILPWITLPPALRTALLAGSGMIAAGIGAFFWIQKHGKTGAMIRWLVARRIGGNRLRAAATHINRVDETVKQFFGAHPWSLWIAVFWHLLGYAVGIFQVWYFLQVYANGPGFTQAAQIWFVGMWFDLLSFAVPLGIGILEGSRMVAFSTAAHAPVMGITYAVVLRMAQLCWAAIGLASYALLLSRQSSSTAGKTADTKALVGQDRHTVRKAKSCVEAPLR